MKLSRDFWIVLAFVGFSLTMIYLGALGGRELEQRERGTTMTIVQVEAWCTRANLIDYQKTGATNAELKAAVPQIHEFCSRSIMQFRKLLEYYEEKGEPIG